MKDNAQPARWYMVNRDGMATLCTDRADAEKEAADAQIVWPHMGPHRAVQLVEAADVEALRAGYAAARMEIESLRGRVGWVPAAAAQQPGAGTWAPLPSTLPPMGEPLAGGTFAGIITQPDGAHVAVVLLPERCKDISHSAAVAWAQEMGGQLPTRPIAAMLFANVRPLLSPRWHWCLETEDASYAWYCYFSNGRQGGVSHESFEGSAVAIRLIPVVAKNND